MAIILLEKKVKRKLMRIVVVLPTRNSRTQYFPAFLGFARLGNLVVACNLSNTDYKYNTTLLTDIHTIYFCSPSVSRLLCFLFSVIHEQIFSVNQLTIQLSLFFSNKMQEHKPFLPRGFKFRTSDEELIEHYVDAGFWLSARP